MSAGEEATADQVKQSQGKAKVTDKTDMPRSTALYPLASSLRNPVTRRYV